MTLFGKILALFNALGAVGLVFLAFLDYGKRQTWAYSLVRHELVLTGLPIDEKEETSTGAPIADLLGQDTLGKIFKEVGDPVATQLQEVERVHGQIDSRIQAAATNKRAQTVLLARILLPFADNHIDREQLLICRGELADDAKGAAFKKRYLDAFRQALLPPPPPEEPRPFPEAFRAALRAQGGMSSEAFTNMIVKALPDDAKKAAGVNIDKVYEDAFEAQRAQMEARYRGLFDDALEGPVPAVVVKGAEAIPIADARKRAIEAQKTAIARLLFGLCMFQTEEAVDSNPELQKAALFKGLPRDSLGFRQRLAYTSTFGNQLKRVYIVCGLRAGLGAVTDRTAVLRKLTDYVEGAILADRQQFVADHAALVEQIRYQATLVQQELASKTENERKLTLQEEQVKKRERDVKQHKEEYDKSKEQTAKKMTELKDLSGKLLEDRLKARDLIRLSLESEKTIRELERQIIELERKR
jgi:hypothetical protein